ncbi:DNA-binding NtrC family response regulator [Bradyrhizobium sp. AZCC 1610]|uniref:sigma-54 dependent transcriptional regulator n=1 Tax=Bradyrhizobium sp. AZCC 1610 TaxID=3117020 RepID=UPI002FF19515
MVRLIGQSRPHLETLDKLSRVAGTDAEVLISGPTGVGKELYALYVHERSRRASFSFVPVNCGAIPLELLENELFGHRGGAYTSAGASQEGLVAEAENGTLFLDEVDTLSLPSQVKLLRFIQQKEYRRLGDSRIRTANVRFIAATNADLPLLVEQGRFRSDLYYRLCVFPVDVLPLTSRKDDVPFLIDEYSGQYSEQYHLPKIVLSTGAFQAMLDYPWPGNVRELENCVKYLTCLQLARPVDKYDLPMLAKSIPASVMIDDELLGKPFTSARKHLVSQFEKRYVSEALRRTNGNITRAASECGEYPKKISRLIKKHGLSREGTPDQSSATDCLPWDGENPSL